MVELTEHSVLGSGQDCIRLVVARPVDPSDPSQPVSIQKHEKEKIKQLNLTRKFQLVSLIF